MNHTHKMAGVFRFTTSTKFPSMWPVVLPLNFCLSCTSQSGPSGETASHSVAAMGKTLHQVKTPFPGATTHCAWPFLRFAPKMVQRNITYSKAIISSGIYGKMQKKNLQKSPATLQKKKNMNTSLHDLRIINPKVLGTVQASLEHVEQTIDESGDVLGIFQPFLPAVIARKGAQDPGRAQLKAVTDAAMA